MATELHSLTEPAVRIDRHPRVRTGIGGPRDRRQHRGDPFLGHGRVGFGNEHIRERGAAGAVLGRERHQQLLRLDVRQVAGTVGDPPSSRFAACNAASIPAASCADTSSRNRTSCHSGAPTRSSRLPC
ncbi:hypothetical protein NJ76_20055, partial [Rhodococcus sp. IITR03]